MSKQHAFENKQEQEKAGTYLVCPASVDLNSNVPDDPFDQILRVLSSLPLTSKSPSALKQTDLTLCLGSVSMCDMKE